MAVERKCSSCGNWNRDNDYCATCGNPISPRVIEQIREKAREEERLKIPPTKLDVFIHKWKNSRFLPLRWLYKILYTIAFIFFAVASFFAWLAATPNG